MLIFKQRGSMINVIIIRNQVVNENYSFVDAQKAETFFLNKINDFSIDPLSEEDKRSILDDGYFELPEGGSICLAWATVIDN